MTATFTVSPSAAATPIHIANSTQLFVDDFLVATTRDMYATLSSRGQHDVAMLEFPASSAANTLQSLKAALLAAGVQKAKVDELKANMPLNAKQYLATLARARPQEIHVIVTPSLNGQAGGGLSSGPGTNPSNRQVSTVIVRSAETVSHMVLAHEMGHYFGLTHPHARLDQPAEVAPASLDQLVANLPWALDDLVTSLKTHLGEDLDGDGVGNFDEFVAGNLRSDYLKRDAMLTCRTLSPPD